MDATEWDYNSEAYGSSVPDPWYEAYCDYSMDMEDAGQVPLSMADWRAGIENYIPEPLPVHYGPHRNPAEDIPF